MTTEDEIAREKAKLNEEWYKLVAEEERKTRAVYDRLHEEGKYTYTLDGPEPPEVLAIEKEFKPKYDDVMRRYEELVKETKGD